MGSYFKHLEGFPHNPHITNRNVKVQLPWPQLLTSAVRLLMICGVVVVVDNLNAKQ